jgi:hypothetical protein
MFFKEQIFLKALKALKAMIVLKTSVDVVETQR